MLFGIKFKIATHAKLNLKKQVLQICFMDHSNGELLKKEADNIMMPLDLKQ